MNETNTVHDFGRLEAKVDKLTDAISQLVLFEERQSLQATAMADLTIRMTSQEKKLDMWINRGIGVWAVFASAMAVIKTFH